MKNASKTFAYLAIRTEDLTRRYKGFVAVDKLNLAVRAGEIYGFQFPLDFRRCCWQWFTRLV